MPEPFGQPQSTDVFKRASSWLDELYKPVSEPLGSAFGAVGKAVSPKLEQPFRQVGQGLPRLATEAFLSTRGAKIPRALGFGDVALQSMGQTADQGLSPAQRIGTAGLQTAAFAAAPKAAEALSPRFGELAAPLTEKIRQVGGKSLGALMQTTAEKGGSLVGMLGTFEGANAASSAVMGQPDYFKRMLEPEHIASTVATVLPFEALGFPAALKRTFDVRRAMDERQNLWYDKLTQQDAADREAQRDVLTRQREESPDVQSASAMEHEPEDELFRTGMGYTINERDPQNQQRAKELLLRHDIPSFLHETSIPNLAKGKGYHVVDPSQLQEVRRLGFNLLKEKHFQHPTTLRTPKVIEYVNKTLETLGLEHGPIARSSLLETLLHRETYGHTHILDEIDDALALGAKVEQPKQADTDAAFLRFPDVNRAKLWIKRNQESYGDDVVLDQQGTLVRVPVRVTLELNGFDWKPFMLGDILTGMDPEKTESLKGFLTESDAKMRYQDLEGFYTKDPEKLFGDLVKISSELTRLGWKGEDWSPEEGFKEARSKGLMPMHQGPELITHSAFVPDPTKPENVEYGAHHPEILERLGVKGFEAKESRNTPQFGYKTTLRPFITRPEASELINRTGQKVDLEAPIQVHSDKILSASEAGKTVAEQRTSGNVERVIGSGPIAVKVGGVVYAANSGTHGNLVNKYNLPIDEVVPGYMTREGVFTAGKSELRSKRPDEIPSATGVGTVAEQREDLWSLPGPQKDRIKRKHYSVKDIREPYINNIPVLRNKFTDEVYYGTTHADALNKIKAVNDTGVFESGFLNENGDYFPKYHNSNTDLQVQGTLSPKLNARVLKLQDEFIATQDINERFRISDEISALERSARKSVESTPKLSAMATDDLRHSESLGASLKELADQAIREQSKDRLPNESVAEHAARVNGVTKEVLTKADPQALLRTFTSLTKHIATTHLGWSEDKANFWAEKAARLVGIAGGLDKGNVRVFPASAYVQEGQSRAASFYVPRPNPFIGLYVRPFQSPERTMFEFFHGFGHEWLHHLFEQLVTNPESLTAEVHTALKNLLSSTDTLKLASYEMGNSIQGALRTMGGKEQERLLDYRKPFYKETPEGRVEYLCDLYGIQLASAASDRSSRAFAFSDDVMKFGNDDVRNFAAGVYKDIGQLFKHVAEMLKKTFGWSNLSVNRLDRIVDNMKHLIASKEEGDRAVETFLTTMQAKDARPWAPTSGLSYDRVNKFYRMIQGESYDVDAMAFAKDFGPAIVPQEDKPLPEVFGAGKRLRWPDFFKPVIQLAKSIPELADMAWLGGNLGTVSHHAAVKMWSFLNVPGTERMDLDMWNKATQTDSRLGRLWSKAALLQNSLEGPQQGQFLERKTISEMPEYKALDDKERTWFNDIFSAERIGKVHIQAALENVNSVKWQLGFALARVVQAADKSLPWQQAQKIGRAIAVIHTDQDRLQEVGGRFGDPALVEEMRSAHELIEGYAQSNPKAVQDALDVFRLDENGQPIDTSSVAGKSKSLVDKYKDYRDKMLGEWQPPDAKNGNWHFLGKPGFSSEVRIGKWTVAWLGKDDKTPSLVAFKDQKDFNAKVQALEKAKLAGDVVWWKGHNKEDQEDLFKGMSPGQFTDYSNFMDSVNNRVLAAIKRKYPEATDVLNELQNELRPTAAQAFAALLEAPYMKERRLLGGRETLNMAEGVVHYVNSVAHTVGKRFARGQQALYLNDPKMRGNPELQKTARQYFDEVVDPKERGFGSFKALIALNYIFFSPSLAFVEGTQQLTNHIPALASAGMPWGQAVKSVVKANKDMAEAWIEGRKRGTKLHVYSNPEEHAMIERAVKDGLIDRGWLQEQFHTRDDLPFLNQHNVLAGDGKLLDRNELLGKALYHMYRFGRDAHGMMITMNSEVAALSAYRYFKSIGQGAEQAYRSTWDLTRESMHGGGRSSRPLWYLGVGPLNPGSTVGGLMYTLQMYVYNTVAQMCRYGYNAMFNSKLDKSERASFAKGFATMAGAQLFFAGVMGIPVTSQMFALVEQMFPNTEPKRRARELFYGAGKWLNDKTHILKQDEDMGHFVEDAAMDGLMGQITPVQMSNRFELGVLLGVDPYQGFSWKNVVGPGGSLLEQILLKPAQTLAQGHPLDAAFEAFPNSNVRRLAQLAANGWQLRNRDDRLNQQLTGAESTLLALGFTPSKVAEFRAQNEMKLRAEKVNALEQKKFHADVAQMVLEGRVEDAQTALFHRAQTVEGYSPREGARRVAELVQAKTEPFDPYDRGSRTGGTYNVAQLFPSATSTGSEVDKALRRAGLVQQLGFPDSPSKTELAEGQYIDEIRRWNPLITRQEAKRMLESQLHPSRTMW